MSSFRQTFDNAGTIAQGLSTSTSHDFKRFLGGVTKVFSLASLATVPLIAAVPPMAVLAATVGVLCYATAAFSQAEGTSITDNGAETSFRQRFVQFVKNPMKF